MYGAVKSLNGYSYWTWYAVEECEDYVFCKLGETLETLAMGILYIFCKYKDIFLISLNAYCYRLVFFYIKSKYIDVLNIFELSIKARIGCY